MDSKFEEMKETMNKTIHDGGLFSSAFSSILGVEHIPTESLGAMGFNVTLEEFLNEMKRHGLEVRISPKKKKEPAPPPTAGELAEIPLGPDVEDTPENRARYAKMKEEAQKKLRDTSFIQTVLETERPVAAPVDEAALDDLNTASYLGEYSALRGLSKKLKPKDSENSED